MTTSIQSNGSKWAGEPPDSIPVLLKVLKTHPLDKRFGRFVTRSNVAGARSWFFFGNFFTISHVFSIETDEEPVARELTSAIRANQRRQDYQSQERVT